MNTPPADDDIVAVATPPGRGAISIVRLSGGGIPALCKTLIGELPRARYATLCDFKTADGQIIDTGLAFYFPAPKSYTGEHALELHGHGSPVVMKMLLRRCLELGARLARPGEFSERAFLNGRLDLAQAEAVADLITSGTEAAARSAVNALHGAFSERIHALVGALTELRILVEAAIDFPEETADHDSDGDENISARLQQLQHHFAQLHTTARRGQILRDGLNIVLTGAPNAGKSSLLNVLAHQPRAIVSTIPGTTRDLLEQEIDLDGLPLVITDTAGIREGTDEVEREGVRRAMDAQRRADLILLVVDDSDTDDGAVDEMLRAIDCAGEVCVVKNKIDLTDTAAGQQNAGVAVSVKTGAGMQALTDYIKHHAGFRDSEQSPFIARQRHLDAIHRAAACLDAAVQHRQTPELLAEELTACQKTLGEITGEVTSDDLLGLIFSEFCIGK